MSAHFIAGFSNNHHGDLDRRKRYIYSAAEIGCDSV
jgi:sialic acid synthase SpsE